MTGKFPRLAGPAILSPMAGVTDVAFRVLCKRYGAAMTCTEFVSSAALVRDNARTMRMLETDPSERPVAVQLFGANDEEVVQAARFAEKGFDVIDLNCGCPAHKVVRTGAGSAMLRDPRRVARLVEAVAASVRKPVTVKIRSGIDERHINAVEVARAAETAGAAAIIVHGRTQRQGYSGTADWSVVAAVKEAVEIPVIGNGDIFSAQDFVEKKALSGCDYVMVGRGAIGNPLIFQDILAACKEKNVSATDIQEKATATQPHAAGDETTSASVRRQKLFLAYVELARRYEVPFGQVKFHALSFTKGQAGGARLRERIVQAKDVDSLLRLVS